MRIETAAEVALTWTAGAGFLRGASIGSGVSSAIVRYRAYRDLDGG
jgi:hypothetical protein